ncbi:MAG: deoxyribonuclease IV, partial [Bdellovibrionales bacterium]|nr:deoxyribonuclease IV [Bdellovibrionales bacterium]
RVVQAIDEVMKRADHDGRLILEVAAGSGKIIGADMNELRRIYDGLFDSSRVGFGLDTQHMWASGYDFQNNLEGIVSHIESIFGLSNVWCVHLNDSKVGLGSKRDRHENIGEGMIGKEALTAFLNHPKLSDIPFVLETPALKEMETAKKEVNKVKGLLAPL